jgi:hypothetical protein
MTLTQHLTEYVRACFTGIWIESRELSDALAEIRALCQAEHWMLAHWNLELGMSVAGHAVAESPTNDPLAAIRSLRALAHPEGTALLVLENFHRFLQSAEIVQALIQQIQEGKQRRTFIIILSPVVQLPIELENLFVVIEHDLPGRDQLLEIAQGIATEEGELPTGAPLDQVLDAAMGLTRFEAEGAFSLSLIRHRSLTPEAVWELKTGLLKKSGLLSLHRGGETFRDLGGLDPLKAFCRRSLLRTSRPDRQRPRPRGILLLSPPGCGKSQFAKALGQETGRPTLILDIGGLLGSLVGQSEQNIRRALKIADAMAPCILFVDEIEKALSGASGSQGDSGVSARLFGSLLTWLNDHTSDVYFVGTCNDISRLPPEFSRAERFDGIFFLDLPDQETRATIWNLYLTQYGLDLSQPRPADQQWTGAEIKACCRLSALLDLPLQDAARHIVPVAVTAAESVGRLREWASGRCLSADQGGIYQAAPGKRKRRAIAADPSNN